MKTNTKSIRKALEKSGRGYENKMLDNIRWGLRDIFKVFLFYFLMMMVGIPVLLKIVKQLFGLDLVELFGQNTIILSLSLIINILACLYVFYIIRVGYRQPLTALGLTINNWKADVRFGLKHYLIILPFIVLAGYAVDFVSRIFGITPENQEIITKLLEEDSIAVLAFMIFFGTLAAPIIEELLFRGFLQSAIRTTFGKLKAIFISGSLFALVHLNAHVFLQIFILGLLLAYLFEKTESLIAPITVHILHNSITLAFLISFKQLLKDNV